MRQKHAMRLKANCVVLTPHRSDRKILERVLRSKKILSWSLCLREVEHPACLAVAGCTDGQFIRGR